ncbi:elongation factor 1-beta [Candidatus Woesearchaeota archaeon]|nr:elongation factor 1-beta [Candidatus Woesearchaeota archaeon]
MRLYRTKLGGALWDAKDVMDAKMATVLITIKIMPESPDVNLDWVLEQASPKISSVGSILKTEKQPIAFGLNALMITFSMDEKKGDTEPLEKDLASLTGVSSAEAVDVRRAIG